MLRPRELKTGPKRPVFPSLVTLKFPAKLDLTPPPHRPSLRAPTGIKLIRMANITERGVSVKKGESVDRALKRLKTKLDTEGIIEEMRRRRAFETPTQRKIRKFRTSIKRHRIRWRYISEATDAKMAEKKAAREAAEKSS